MLEIKFLTAERFDMNFRFGDLLSSFSYSDWRESSKNQIIAAPVK